MLTDPRRARALATRSAAPAESAAPRTLALADLSVANKLGKLIPFKPLPAQERIRALIAQQRAEIEAGTRPYGRVRLVIVKARQMGMSTESEAQMLQLVATRPYSEALVIAHVSESASHLHGIATRFWRTLPDAVRPIRKAQNARGITFAPPLESRLGIEVVGEGAGRSRTLHGLHASEVALWPGDVRETLAALRGGLVSEPWCLEILESTGYGLGGGFYDEYQAAKKDGRALFFPWYEDPRYRTRPAMTLDDVRRMGGEREAIEHIEATVVRVQEAAAHTLLGRSEEVRSVSQANGSPDLDGEQLAWLAQKLLGEYGGDVRRFKREFPATEEEAFTGDARQVFSEAIIERVSASIHRFGSSVGGSDTVARCGAPGAHLVRVLEEPGGPDSAYVIGADPAEGLEHGDDSALCVIDRVRRRVCAIARTGLDPDEFAVLLAALGKYYLGAWICVELNGPGVAVIALLRRLGYGRLWRERQSESVDERLISNIGYRTTASSKARAVGSLIENIRSGLSIPFPEFRDQAVTFVRDERGKMGAIPGCKDDVISAAWLAAIAADELGISDPITEKQRELALQPNPFRDPLAKGMALGTLSEVLEAGGGEPFDFALEVPPREAMIGGELRRR